MEEETQLSRYVCIAGGLSMGSINLDVLPGRPSRWRHETDGSPYSHGTRLEKTKVSVDFQ